jgi:hypothetical protein
MEIWRRRAAPPGSPEATAIIADLAKLSLAVRHAPERPVLTLNNWREVTGRAPRWTLDEKIDRLVRQLSQLGGFGHRFEFAKNGLPLRALYAAAGASSLDEGRFLLGTLEEHGLAKLGWDSEGFRGELTSAAWRALEVQRTPSSSGRCFVAMWFNDEMADAWTGGFKVGIERAGMEPRRVDEVDHVNKICDQIAIEIEAAEIVIADVTGFRSGVFFEAGYAAALGKPVMWTCREDFHGQLGDHFDTRQYNHLKWKAPDDLAELVAAKLPVLRWLKPRERDPR